MTVFRPFHGCRYNPSVVGDLASVLCPPYDMIGPELQESLKRLSPYNAVHLEGGEQPDPVAPEAGYRQASARFRQWLEEGVLQRDQEPSFYLMRHGYEFRGEYKEQLGLFGGVQIEEYDSRIVLPHEYTREPAVLDRVALLDYCQAQFSPIMTNYRDAEGTLQPVFSQVMETAPVLEVKDSPDGDVALWRITDPALQERISAFFTQKPVFLADGHHRYEAALRYRKEQQSKGRRSPDAAYNYVMMALVEFDDPGLLLLPYHRTVEGLSPDQLSQVRDGLDELFESQAVDMNSESDVERLLEQVAFLGKDGHALAMVGPEKNQAYLLMLRPGVDWQQWGDLAISEAWIMDAKVLRPILGDSVTQYVNYSHDHQQAVQQVNSGQQQLAFLLKPFPLDAFESIVGGGQRLPSKSTFFYPKLPTGLVINQLEGNL
jgi:uncharacterized protein (DUF1015 family)